LFVTKLKLISNERTFIQCGIANFEQEAREPIARVANGMQAKAGFSETVHTQEDLIIIRRQTFFKVLNHGQVQFEQVVAQKALIGVGQF